MLNLSISFVGLIMFMSGLIILARQKKSFLSLLLSLEMCNVGVFLALSTGLMVGSTTPGVIMFYFVVCVCEAAIGLAVLVVVARNHGHDYISAVSALIN